MRVLVIRHAQAVPQGSGIADADRPLTPEGERRFRAAARGLARLLPSPDALLTSPLLRARQTAALAASAWTGIEPVVEPALASGSVDAILAALEHRPREATIALVGHEPTVSSLVAELVGARSGEAVAFEPGAAALLDVSSLAARQGRLLWFLPNSVAGAVAGVDGRS
jgi:phosphohistidine phosphatase